MKLIQSHSLRTCFTLALALVAGVASAQSVGTIAYQLAGNANQTDVTLVSSYQPDGSKAEADINQSFTGLDSNGNTQTMTYNSTCWATATYGQMHLYSTGTLTNSYYNASNPLFDSPTSSGSPDYMASLTFGSFSDTFQYGGALQAGYQAVYIFHVDGTNSGIGGAADLDVHVDGYTDQGFFDFNNGPISTDWVTQSYAINGTTPQNLSVQFSNQVVFNTPDIADGSNVWGTSDFGDTLTLAGIAIVDANGNVVPTSQWTVTSGSGTHYDQSQAVPEPSSFLILGTLALPFLFRKARRS